MATNHAQRKALGDFGERLAERHLRERGYIVLDRNWRCREGEIDIVAKDAQTLVICEVKTRSSDRFGTAYEAITPAKAERLYRLGRHWARDHAVVSSRLRVDVVAVLIPPHGPRQIEHVEGVG
ncbi:MAG: YraN family protein [Nocardioidaceae bacterium]